MFGCNLAGMAHWGSWFTAFLFLGAGLLLICHMWRAGRKKPVNTDRIDSMEILKARLARGDISLEQYNILKTALNDTESLWEKGKS